MKTKLQIASLLSVLLLSGCVTTNNKMAKYKEVASDTAVLCGGNTEDIYYNSTDYSTTIRCNGKTYSFTEDRKRGILGFIQKLTH